MKHRRNRMANAVIPAIALVAMLSACPIHASADIVKQYIRVSCAKNLRSAKMEYTADEDRDLDGFVALEDLPQFDNSNDVAKGLPVCKIGPLSEVNIKAVGWDKHGAPREVLIYRNGARYVDPIFFYFDNHELKEVIFKRPLANSLPVTLCSTDSVCVRRVLKAPANRRD